MTDELVTERLRLLPITYNIADAALSDRRRLEELVGARLSDEWPNPDFKEALSFIRVDVRKNRTYSRWSRLVVHDADNVVIGDAGFKSLPGRRGSVELGYGIVPEYRNQGFAFEAARALVEWAWRDSRVKHITAESLIDNLPSRRVLEKLGMEITGEADGRDGRLHKWVLKRFSQ
jgi:ribosomal-protein-alanine N-acetyltransferase